MLQDIDNLSLQAIGLLANLTSMPDSWVLHKTELYTRYAKNGRRSVLSAWNELIENNYIIQFKKRDGKSYDYIYYHNQEGFTVEDIKKIEEMEGTTVWDGKHSPQEKTQTKPKQKIKPDEKTHETNNSSDVHFEQSKLGSPKRTDNRFIINEVNNKDKDTYKDTLEDTKRYSSESSNQSSKEKMLKDSLKTHMPDSIHHTLSTFTKDYQEMYDWFGIILRAKKEVEKQSEKLILLEDYEEEINGYLMSGIRKIKTDHRIKKPKNYLFTTIQENLGKHISEIERSEVQNSSIYNWLDAGTQ